MRPNEHEVAEALRAAASLFAANGFHGATLGDLEAATGLSRDAMLEAFRDKESLFYAAIETRRADLAEGDASEPADQEPLLGLLPRLEKANSQTKLRSIHRQAFAQLLALLQEAAPEDGTSQR